MLLTLAWKQYNNDDLLDVCERGGAKGLDLRHVSGGVVVAVFVKPNSKQFQLKIEGDELVVLCRESPVKGRVNKELIKELSRIFQSRVEIVAGFRSKQKKVLIKGMNMEEARSILSKYESK